MAVMAGRMVADHQAQKRGRRGERGREKKEKGLEGK